MDVSVVVPSYNSEKTIRACLGALCSQKTRASYEVIVVDSSFDQTPEIVKSYPKVRLIRAKKRLYAGEARNRGVKSVKGRIIAFTDADCVPSVDWIENLSSLHKRHEFVGGLVLNGNPESLVGWSLFLAQFSEFSVPRDREVRNMPTCNASYEKSAFSEFGFFPDVFSHEEFIFNSRLPGIFFSKSVVIKHINRTSFFEVLRHSYKNGQGAAFSRKTDGRLSLVFTWKFPMLFIGIWRFFKCALHSARGGNAAMFVLAGPLILLNMLSWNLGFIVWTMRN